MREYKPIFTEKEKKKNKRKEKANEILMASAILSAFFLAGNFTL